MIYNTLKQQSVEAHAFDIDAYLNYTEENVYNPSYAECGRSWLFNHTNLFLTVYKVTNNSIHIKNVNPNASESCKPSQVSIFVDIIGTEYLGGVAIPSADDEDCEWTYSFKVRVSGNYSVQARLLSFNGDADFD